MVVWMEVRLWTTQVIEARDGAEVVALVWGRRDADFWTD